MSLESAFLAAAKELRDEGYQGVVFEICAVLNQMPSDLLDEDPARCIADVDELLDDLYRSERLTCPGHRWLSEPPRSIRGCLIFDYDHGNVWRDEAGRWQWKDTCFYFTLVDLLHTRLVDLLHTRG